MTSGIYQIRNLLNDKSYIGSSAQIGRRFKDHQMCLRGDYHNNSHLQRSWNKYGEDTFEFSVLILCHPSMCAWYEQQFLDQWKPEYNTCPTAYSSLGYKHTKNALRKIGAASRRRHSDEHNRKMSEAMRNRKHSDEHNRKIGKANAKPYPSFIDPNGIIHPAGRNLCKFCREHGLNGPSMWMIVHKQRRSHHGWTLA